MNFDFDWNYIFAGAPYVTISELGLAFNTPAISLLGKPEEVVLGFDENKMTIGVKDAKGMEGAKVYTFFSRIRSGWVRIGCKDFVKYLSVISSIDFSRAKKFIAKYDKESQLLYITINEKEVEENESKED